MAGTLLDFNACTYTAFPSYSDAAALAVKIAVDDEDGFYNVERAPNGMGWVVAVYDVAATDYTRFMFYL